MTKLEQAIRKQQESSDINLLNKAELYVYKLMSNKDRTDFIKYKKDYRFHSLTMMYYDIYAFTFKFIAIMILCLTILLFMIVIVSKAHGILTTIPIILWFLFFTNAPNHTDHIINKLFDNLAIKKHLIKSIEEKDYIKLKKILDNKQFNVSLLQDKYIKPELSALPDILSMIEEYYLSKNIDINPPSLIANKTKKI